MVLRALTRERRLWKWGIDLKARSSNVKTAAIHEDQLTARLVEAILGWRATPDRFIKSGRSWTPRSRFKPFARLEDAFSLLDRAGCTYVLSVRSERVFTAEVRVGDHTGKASGEVKARTITLALCQALGIGVA